MRNKLFILALIVGSFLLMRNEVLAQANRTNSGDVTCPVTGSSIQVLAVRSGRYSYTLNNVSGNDLRIGYLASGTAILDTTNSWILKAGQAYSDSAPGLFTGRVVCMTNSGVTSNLSFNETFR